MKMGDIYEIMCAGEKYWAIAELPDIGLLGVRQGNFEKRVYFLPYREDIATLISSSLGEAIASLGSGLSS